ncbi:helix-turn-helix domain-containing protein [Fervidicoccus fontis]|uniref:Putative HTH-type transcriptional regulatory protein C0188_01120 n=1 Tax=Fervidicoccus fontis TaxID=683846 RepID=A0A2J6N7T9_9CREN|nr:helix-turn-helix domain-containing protein [Fervidicoccus fontis]PMB75920.1 MAG: hypothetical protein C0188_01120 [Fervidicoccus fontis]PMB77409.1 MAG: hypothetical protein C0177_03245 [Fervidicoccus fontis]HEW63899.1 helix-turn-helix domain-containing protein [Fervidicoccus fontis]
MKNESSWVNDYLQELLESTVKNIIKSGFEFVKIDRPDNFNERSIDILAWSKDEKKKKIHLKITLDTGFLSKEEIRDLIGITKSASSRPIIVSEYDKKIDIQDEVIYLKENVPTVNVTTLPKLLSCSKDLYIFLKKGEFVVRISGEKMRERREKLGLSLGELANRLGVTRKSIYEYEKNTFDVRIDYADKLFDALGEEIVSPYNIFSDEVVEMVKMKKEEIPDNLFEEKIFNILNEKNMFFYHARKTFVDIIAKKGEEIFFIAIDHEHMPLTLEEKAEQLSKIKKLKDVEKMIVAKKEKAKELKKEYSDEIRIIPDDKINTISRILDERK